jgi:hypothetical protein
MILRGDGLMKLDHPFIQVPLTFDAERLAGEAGAIPEADWRPHPQGFPGNSMLPLLSVNGDPNNETFAGPMRPTPYLGAMPYMRQVIAALGVTAGRTRLMRLDGDAEVSRHVDQGYYWFQRVRVHVPIVTMPSVRFECGDAAVNMAPGECWIFDTWRQHRVLNRHDDRRIHLVVDTVGGARFWDLVARGWPRPSQAPPPGWAAHFIPFDADADPGFAVENFNIPSVMAPGEVETYFAFLLGEAEGDPRLAQARALVDRFILDWRALWAAFGPLPEGKPYYMRRYDAFMTAFQPVASPIVLHNECNVFSVAATGLTRAIVELPRGRRGPGGVIAQDMRVR